MRTGRRLLNTDTDPGRYPVRFASPRGFRQAYVSHGTGMPLLCVHGWPESKRIYWKVIGPLAAAGFEVVVPDLRAYGDSDVGPDGYNDVATHAQDLYSLMHDHLGHRRVVLMGGDLGGPIIQDLALRYPDWVDRMVLFNSPLPFLKEAMADLVGTHAPLEASDYFIRQGREADALAEELSTPSRRRRYVEAFYTSRFWAHPGAFREPGDLAFHTEPFGDGDGDGARLRAGFGAYEAAFDADLRSAPALFGRNDLTQTLILHGVSDHVMYPSFDRMAARVFPRHVGPFLLRDCGHFVPWEAPGPLVSGTIAFCRDLVADQSPDR